MTYQINNAVSLEISIIFTFVNRPETQNYVKRQSGIYGDTYKQDVDMDVIEREQSYREPQRLKFSVATH